MRSSVLLRCMQPHCIYEAAVMMMGPAWMTIDEKVLLAHCCLHTLDESNHNQDKSNRALQEMTSSMRPTLMTNHAQAEPGSPNT